jgi:hypothetical protein
MRKLILVALLTAAPFFALGSTPAAAFGCEWFGYGYGSAYTPRAYSYAPTGRYYRPRAYYGRTFYGPRVRRAYYGRTLYGPRVRRAYYGRTFYGPRVRRAYGYRGAWRGGRRWR